MEYDGQVVRWTTLGGPDAARSRSSSPRRRNPRSCGVCQRLKLGWRRARCADRRRFAGRILSARHYRGGSDEPKLYLTIASVVTILYGIGFVLIPAKMGELYGVQPEPHAILNVQYFGSALLAWGVILWFARDLDWAAVRGVLIGSVVGDAVGGLLTSGAFPKAS